MEKYYTEEKNALVVVSLLKEHGIRKIIASPGTTNMAIVASVQNDPFFEVYSSVDERSAAYMACGLAAESGEPVVLSCTGATASRNYSPGLTEAYYRKLPVLAITSTQAMSKVGHHIAQIIDRSSIPNDVAKLSVTLPVVKDDDDLWDCEIKVNRAILELKRHGGGPVHINIPTTYGNTYTTKELPKFRVINRVTMSDIFPELPQGKVAILIGAHAGWSKEQTDTLDKFCASNDAVVFCDHSSNFKGKYRVLYALAASQKMLDHSNNPDLIIHIGEVTGDYYTLGMKAKQVWRVSEDGEIRDTTNRLRYVFEMPEQNFFKHYTKNIAREANGYLNFCKNHLNDLSAKIPELPFSNIWMASQIAHKIPSSARIHLGILNSLRSWNFFEISNSVLSSSNVGGFGIDGVVSTLIGASFANKNKLFFGVLGDLAFFYDMNVIGNRHVGNNLRILLVNNGTGTEFRQSNHLGSQFGEDADQFIAAGGHFGQKSPILVKHYAQDLGFEYLSASNKLEFEQFSEQFLFAEITDKPILFEVFTNSKDESEALEKMMNIEENMKSKVKNVAKQVLGENSFNMFKKVMGK
ncbi:2-succinyl-5-enolpyruvyl-6-hydroxy-3-cyclohexene-1-carboxylate synthase [Dyadobacter frigoris]|uniref:thiamine pyrophosphate-binding protein n=1 Tax=Dyadobacter frigoris TaxID=2576211 RepID=UPI00249FC348|nr:thiamine pyrophosphate-binding protein [Dyadobacter frigoris]GLU52717.1 2-succinyl-5-enolpyruvyl-6-hydroxy-3-cyclohexene-1-carboxylate synthase [Dyadobacter frigoris]